MKIKLLITVILVGLSLSNLAQTKLQIQAHENERKLNSNEFDESQALKQAKAKGIKASDIKGYVQTLRQEFSSEKALNQQPHKCTPYEGGIEPQERVIYINKKSPTSIGCPNSGFEQYNFANWTGSWGTYSGNAASPVYATPTPVIFNTAGINTPLGNTINYSTLMTIPPTNSVLPNFIGYDSIAARVIGTQTVSEMPFISPFSLDGVSCRMLGAFANFRVSKLKYVMSVGPNSRSFQYSYAAVFNDGHTNDPNAFQPYLRIKLTDQNGNAITGCNDFNQNATVATVDPSYQTSYRTFGGFPIRYKPWSLVTVDLTNPIYAGVTTLNIEFEVAGCSLGGHLGYAYVDAECSQGGTILSYCGGGPAVMTAPSGYSSYQWFDNTNTPIAAPSGTNATISINAPINGDVYSVLMTTPGGCTISISNTIITTQVSINNINSAPSCGGGNSGSAVVTPAGSNAGYTYSWTATSGPNIGQAVSTASLATGLSPGTYSVVVTSTCGGSASANISVGTSPPFFISQTKNYCGNFTTIIPSTVGSNYQWYNGSSGPVINTTGTLTVNTPVVGGIYTLVYNNASGCRDSIRYTLNLVPGGSTFLSNIKNVCPTNTNGSAVFNISSTMPTPYTYSVTSGGSTIVPNTSISSSSINISALAAGVYTVAAYDGICFYNSTFTINPIQTNFTITPTNSVICLGGDSALIKFDFGAGVPTACGTDASLCSGPLTTLFNTGPFVNNGTTNYPTPFSGWWYSGKHQFLVKAADLNAAGVFGGKISSLSFNITALNTSPLIYPGYQIKMGCTSLNDLPTGAGNAFITGLSTVYFNPNQAISLGWLTHNFSQSYVWDGVSNVIIEVCTGGLTTFPANASIQLKQMPYIANMKSISFSSGVSSCPDVNNNGNGTYMANGANMLPNMRFGYCPASPSPSSFTVAVNNGSITNNYNGDSIMVVPPPSFVANGTPYIYSITVTNPTGSCTATQTIAILYPSAQTSITVSSGTTICEGTSLNLNALGATSYTWNYGGSAIANTSSISVTPPAVGNNNYIVTANNSPCPSTPTTKTITINVTPKANLIISPLQDLTKCLNKPFMITTGVNSTTSGNAGTPYSYTWTTLPGNTVAPGVSNTSSYTANANVTQTLVLTVSGVCANPTKDTIVIKNFIDNLSANILDTSTTCAGTEFILRAGVTGGYLNYSYGWFLTPNFSNTIGNSQILTTISPETQGTYTIALVVTDSCGYQRTDFEIINVLPPCNVLIPNIITPNNDGVNDFFKIKNLEFHPNSSLTIFDRWGLKVFENANYNNEWKAESNHDGTYFYILDVPNDKKYNGFITVFHGK